MRVGDLRVIYWIDDTTDVVVVLGIAPVGEQVPCGLMTGDRRRPRRIAVIGRAGSGKTTTALKLGTALGVPVVHLDQLYWTSDWLPVQAERFDELHAAAIAGESWILDGGYLSEPFFVDRVRRADMFVVTEASLVRCVARVILRTIRYRGRARASRPHGAAEAFSLTFLIYIVRWSRRHPDLAAEVRAIDPDACIAVVRGHADIERLLRR